MSSSLKPLQWFNDRSIATKINAITLFVFLVVFTLCGAALSSLLSSVSPWGAFRVPARIEKVRVPLPATLVFPA